MFHGSVVKAIASGMRTYPKILHVLKNKLGIRGNIDEYQSFAAHMEHLFSAHVVSVVRKTSQVIELTIHAPLAAKHFKPGQFYRLQNFETLAPRVDHTLFQMEPLALISAECDVTHGTLTFIVIENSANAKLCALLKPGEPVSLMGPTGARAKIPTAHETVLVVGNETSFAFLRNYGAALRANGNRVIYAVQVNNQEEVYCQSQLEAAADIILWLTKTGAPTNKNRTQDFSFNGNDIVKTIAENANNLGLSNVDRIYVVGDPDLLRRFQAARKTLFKDLLLKDPIVIGSVYGNMQCMLKGVCAQCLQWQIDPETGQRTKAVFACSWQDQPLEIIDIDHIDERQMQNRLLEQLSKLWIDHLFVRYNIERV